MRLQLPAVPLQQRSPERTTVSQPSALERSKRECRCKVGQHSRSPRRDNPQWQRGPPMALVPAGATQEADGDLFPDRWSSPKERWNVEGVALQNKVFSSFIGTENIWVPLVVTTQNGENIWACERHPLNQRWDQASVASRKASVETVGIIQGLRGGAWLIPRDDVPQDPAWGQQIQFYYVLHWATLIEGRSKHGSQMGAARARSCNSALSPGSPAAKSF